MLISAGGLKIAPVVSVGGVQGDVCVTATGGGELKDTNAPDMSAPEPDPRVRGPLDNK